MNAIQIKTAQTTSQSNRLTFNQSNSHELISASTECVMRMIRDLDHAVKI